MQLHFQQALRALILLSFSTMLFKMHYSGDITKFINPKYEGLSQIASIIFLILFFIQITRIWTTSTRGNSPHHCDHHDDSCHHHDHGDTPLNTKKLISYLVISFPLVTGFFLSPKLLDASMAEKKGAMLILSNQTQASQEKGSEESQQKEENSQEEMDGYDNPIDPNLENQESISEEEYNNLMRQLEQNNTIKMSDFAYAAYYEEIGKNVHKYKGKKIKVRGFVYKENGLSSNQLVISRFLITHCVADASIIGFLSEFLVAPSLEKDTWIEAEGVLDVTTFNGNELPLIKITDWKEIKEPEQPYLYPISVKIM
nr:TIGR03943 family protein [Neobacillus sp. Marseille-Q6967]